jgi:hypothetical protein
MVLPLGFEPSLQAPQTRVLTYNTKVALFIPNLWCCLSDSN